MHTVNTFSGKKRAHKTFKKSPGRRPGVPGTPGGTNGGPPAGVFDGTPAGCQPSRGFSEILCDFFLYALCSPFLMSSRGGPEGVTTLLHVLTLATPTGAPRQAPLELRARTERYEKTGYGKLGERQRDRIVG